MTNQSLSCNSGNPVRTLEGQVHPFVSLIDIIWAESRPLEVFPVYSEIPAALINTVAQPPVMSVGPGGICRNSQRAKSSPVVGEVLCINGITLGKNIRTYS